MKKTSYNTKSRDELMAELKALRTTVQTAIAKRGQNSKEYTAARKNIARVLTALTALPAETSTEVKK